jgi:hypothetical protein
MKLLWNQYLIASQLIQHPFPSQIEIEDKDD